MLESLKQANSTRIHPIEMYPVPRYYSQRLLRFRYHKMKRPFVKPRNLIPISVTDLLIGKRNFSHHLCIAIKERSEPALNQLRMQRSAAPEDAIRPRDWELSKRF